MSDTQNRMTDEEYVSGYGLTCPYCRKSEGVQTSGSIEVGVNVAMQNVVCNESEGGCGAEWTDEYCLSGYSPVE